MTEATISTDLYFSVADIATGKILYTGTNEADAARALVPGTCFGAARSWLDAQADARRAVGRFRKREEDRI